ncbi:DUF389 domain-containing protein [Nocardioides coralli]|uniref:DUF389 domain-containing protein n=1 Tax=Nocardioides coralli TaxID=2872154 RepID=UPI001CA3D350|nr:DUF389 domain-containing protein [Nocardioides coralli]QZY28478.1 DUF389 domain-containing protein [Nocardioides coralli]
MLEHLRLTVPPALVDDVLDLLVDNPCVTNLVRFEGVSLVPEGDLVECDVAREVATELLDDLHDVGLSERGGIVVLSPDNTPFAEAERIAAIAPGDPEDAVIWPEVVERAEGAGRPTVGYLAFSILAVTIAAVAVITDSPILVVGAMVVGPEFGTVAAISVGVVLGKWAVAGRGALLLAGGFVVAILAVTVLALLAALSGLVDAEMLSRPRPQTNFIWRPDVWSFVVALVAGAAGVLAMTTDRDNAMVGVFISVTTVPAAGNFSLALALWDVPEMVGSAQQLGVNVLGMVVSGIAVILLQRLLWKRVLVLSDRVLHPFSGADGQVGAR